MTNTIEIVNAAVALIIKAALLASRFSGRTRKRSLKRLSKTNEKFVFAPCAIIEESLDITRGIL